MHHKKMVYSHYKSQNTFKALIGIALNGTVIFVSELFGGSTSDKQIVSDSGFLDLLVPGECVLADKGFLIADLLPRGVCLNIPPFLRRQGGKKQFTESQGRATTEIARARIHVERVMSRLKIFKCLSKIRRSDRRRSSIMLQTCAGLVNFQAELIQREARE